MEQINPKIQFIKALQKAQKEFPSLEKSKNVNQGKFSYDYLPLEQMLSLIQPVLHENGLHLSQLFGYTPTGQTLLKTKLVHENGHEEISEEPLFIPPRDLEKKNEMHVWGGSVTYQRRYSIKLILGLETDMDNNMEIVDEYPKKKPKANVQPKQNIAVLARDAIVKSTTDAQLDQHFNTLVARLEEGKITEDQYNKLIDLIKARRKALTP
tara:strand:- start:216 stop:845 length:630 start_codon:yes stop_codon:yes gene_type:complete